MATFTPTARPLRRTRPAPTDPSYVIVDGPFATQERWGGDEVAEYSVQIIAHDGRTLKHYTPRTYTYAVELGGKIASDRGIEYVCDATPT